jgi:DNA-binding response OmpR family regulator
MAYHVLIVDDDPGSRIFLHHLFKREGFIVQETSDGGDALELLKQGQHDVVVLDLLLPNVSGLDILRYIYRAPHLKMTRVIVVSAHDEFREIELRSGDQYLVKPVAADQLRAAARLALSSFSQH